MGSQAPQQIPRTPSAAGLGDSVVLLASGGLDSTTMAYWLLSHDVRVMPLFIDYGQHCVETEFLTLIQVLPSSLKRSWERVDVSDVYLGSSSRLIAEADLWSDSISAADLYLPYRNLLFLAIAAAFAQSHGHETVCAAFINSNHAVEIDCSSVFFDRLQALLTDFGSVCVQMPFRDMGKSDVIRLAYRLGVPIGTTYSCQVSSRVPCGACPNCVERLAAIRELS